jgi:RNA polymerase sigma-70 factor, ECF subfamily
MGLESGEPTDEELIVGCRFATPDKKRDLVGMLAERHNRGLLNFLFSIVHDREVAEDLVQETFIRVYKSAENYQTIARFSTWLYRIGRNLALNEIRNRKRRPALVLNQRTGGGHDDEGGDVASMIAGDVAEPGDIVEKMDTARLVRAVIKTLPDTFREVLVICDLQKMSYQEAAEVLDIKIGTVRSRLSRARGQFEEKMRRAMLNSSVILESESQP